MKNGIGWKKLDTHNLNVSVLDYKKQEQQKKIKALKRECEDIETVVEIKRQRVEYLGKRLIERNR